MVEGGSTIVGFFVVVGISATVGYWAGSLLGGLISEFFQEETRDNVIGVLGVIGGIVAVALAVYWIYF
jgi:hypothetical protein